MRSAIVFLLLSSVNVFAQSPKWAFLSDLEKEVIHELNLARTQPRQYAEYVKDMLQYFDGKYYKYPGEITLVTQEGKSAVKECYEFLMSVDPVGPLRGSKGLSLAASDHVDDQGPSGETGHTGSDGSSPFDRIERYGSWLSTAGENIDYGNNDARRIVLSLLIDDGVPSRGHRTNIFNPDFKAVGIATGRHKTYRHMCVMALAGGFKAKAGGLKVRGDEDPEEE
jgi:uncharacterized protein YkwD